MKFTKLHGAGNDFIIFTEDEVKDLDLSALAKKVCNRHFGIGADGMMIVKSSEKADVFMSFYNGDGSIAPMCGNGIRCFAKYIYDEGIVTGKEFEVDTLAGIMKPKITVEEANKNVTQVRVNLGRYELNTGFIPVRTDKEEIIEEIVNIKKGDFKISVINLGTIHTVMFVDDLETFDIEAVGKEIENHPMFPAGTNVNFCQIVDSENLIVHTWERGAGLTLACGTGASASAVISEKVKDANSKVKVKVKGGILEIENIEGDVYMTGPAEKICSGNYEYGE